MADQKEQRAQEQSQEQMNATHFLSQAVVFIGGHRRELEQEARAASEKRKALVELGRELGVALPQLPPSREERLLETLTSAEVVTVVIKKGVHIVRVVIDSNGARFDEAPAQSTPAGSTPTEPKSRGSRASRSAIPDALRGTRIRARGEPGSETTAENAVAQHGSLARWLAATKGWTAANIYAGYIEYLAEDGTWRQFTR